MQPGRVLRCSRTCQGQRLRHFGVTPSSCLLVARIHKALPVPGWRFARSRNAHLFYPALNLVGKVLARYEQIVCI